MTSRLDRRAWLACGTAALLAGLVYLNALHNPFVYDDYHTVVANPSIVHVTDARAIVLHDVTRPIVNLSYAIDRALWGAGPFGFHVTNVLLHVINVILLFRLAWLFTQGSTLVAFAAAALFAVHPMMTEAVGYISGRSEVLCATFFLPALMCGRRWLRAEGTKWAIATLGLWVAALATKETAAMFPFVFVAYDRLAEGGRPPGKFDTFEKSHRMATVHLPFMATALVAGLARVAVLTRIEYPGQATIHWSYILLDLDVLRRYLGLMIVPTGQALFHEVTPAAGMFEPRALLAIGTLAAIVFLAWRLRRVAWMASFGILWFLLLLVPSAALIVLDQGEPMTEHRVYLASCGAFLAVGAAIGWLEVHVTRIGARARPLAARGESLAAFDGRGILAGGVAPPSNIPDILGRRALPARRLARLGATPDFHHGLLAAAALGLVLVLVLLSFGMETLVRNSVWSDPVALWRESVELAPTHFRPRLLLGEALQDAGRRDEAIEQFQTAIRLRPADPSGYVQLGRCLADSGRLREARPYFLKALDIDPRNVSARQSLTILDELQSRLGTDVGRR